MTRKAGIYAYLLTGEERHLSIRAFTAAMKQTAFEIQKGICKVCAKVFEIADMEADHITPWSEGGQDNRTELSNAVQALQSQEIQQMSAQG